MREYLRRDGVGIEIGPLHQAICPKRENWNTYILDAYTEEQLKARYSSDPNVNTSLIEKVELLYEESLLKTVRAGSGRLGYDVEQIPGFFDYIVSSHNFEHQPNPIQFLLDCEYCLRVDGFLVMAIPIASRCFDCWLPLTTTGMALDRYLLKAPKPTLGAVFDSLMTQAFLSDGQSVHDQSYDADQIQLNADFDHTFLCTRGQLYPDDYIDAHVSRFNPYSFELFLGELHGLGMLSSLVMQDSAVNGAEFIVRMRKKESHPVASVKKFSAERRTELARQSVLFHACDVSKRS